MGVENRRMPRRKCQVPVTVRSGAGECRAFVVDLSEFGVRLLMENTVTSIAEGEEIEIQSRELGLLRGQTRWRGSHRIGVEISQNVNALTGQDIISDRAEKIVDESRALVADLDRMTARPEMFSKAEMVDLMKRAAQMLKRDERPR